MDGKFDSNSIQRTTIAELQTKSGRVAPRVFIKDAPVRLNDQQAKFVAEYLRNGGNATKAAIAAGYKAGANTSSVATRVRWHPAVRAALDQARENVIASAMIDFETKREFLWELANKAARIEEEEEVTEHEEDGRIVRTVVVRQKLLNARDAIDAIHELNVMDGDIRSSTNGSSGGFNIENALLLIRGGKS